MAREGRTIPATAEPDESARPARNRRKAAGPSVGRSANRGPAAAEHAAPAEGRRVELAKARGRTRRTREHQAKRRRDLERQTVQQLRQRAREAGVQGRSSMTKDQLIRALRGHH
jgi:hypothetical protein